MKAIRLEASEYDRRIRPILSWNCQEQGDRRQGLLHAEVLAPVPAMDSNLDVEVHHVPARCSDRKLEMLPSGKGRLDHGCELWLNL